MLDVEVLVRLERTQLKRLSHAAHLLPGGGGLPALRREDVPEAVVSHVNDAAKALDGAAGPRERLPSVVVRLELEGRLGSRLLHV